MKLSYLRARDPSIISGNRTYPHKVLFGQPKVIDEKVTVYLRLKKTEEVCENYDFTESKIYCKEHNKRNIYEYSHIFDANTTQTDIFNYIAKPKIVEYIEANSFTLLTYGCSGSGKTFTLIGTETEPGIIPRSLCYLFKSLKDVSEFPRWKPLSTGTVKYLSEQESMVEKVKHAKLLQNTSIVHDKTIYTDMFNKMEACLSSEPIATLDNCDRVIKEVWISFLEIYNENVYDLLASDMLQSKSRHVLKVAYVHNKACVKNLTSVHVTSSTEAFELLEYGLNYLNYASTAVNSHSSRSHCMFIVKLVQTQIGSKPIVSHFTFCDMAGSERIKNTHNVGLRLKESNNINTSLFTLQKCIKMIRDSQKNRAKEKLIIPYRESKLTQLLQPALIGEDNISMIVNFNPCSAMYAQSQIVLKFAAISRQISTQENVARSETAFGSNSNLSLNYLLKELEEKRALAKEAEERLNDQKETCRKDAAQLCKVKLIELNLKWKSEIAEKENRYKLLQKRIVNVKQSVAKQTAHRDKLEKIIKEHTRANNSSNSL